MTDGRASGGPPGREASLRAARTLAAAADRLVVFDAEDGRVRLGLAASLADHAGGASCCRLAALSTSGVMTLRLHMNENPSRTRRGNAA